MKLKRPFPFAALHLPGWALLLLLAACSSTEPYRCFNVSTPEEFVSESTLIKQGKSAILFLEGECVQPLDENALIPSEDLIAEDDILNIALFHPSRRDLMESIQFINIHTGGFKVVNGEVNLPGLKPILVQGMTFLEARDIIQEEFCKEIKECEVFITYRARPSHKVEIFGEAILPSYPVDGKVRLFELLSAVKISPHANLHKSYVLRDGQKLDVDLYRLLNEGDMTQNIVMKADDKIYIGKAADSYVLVMGEVRTPRPIPLPYGFMSLREALAFANGIPFTGDRNHIQIIRGGLECPKIFMLSWKFMLYQPNDHLLLIPGDIVYVTQKPITEWNLLLTQLEPTMRAILLGYGIRNLVRD